MRALPLVAALSFLSTLAAAADLQPAQMQKDFDLLRAAMQEAHGGFYRFTVKADLDRRFDAARARFSQPMSPFAYYAILSETLAAIRDGHTRVDGDPESGKALNEARIFPLRVAWQDDGLVVSASGNEQVPPGMRLLSINGKPVQELVRIIRPKISPDGFSETAPARRLARSFSSLYWLLVDQSPTFAVRAQAKTGGPVVSATLQGVTASELRKLDKPVTGDNVTLRFPVEGVGYLRIRGFGGADFRPSVTAAFQSLRDKKAKSLILDLRGNGGGADMLGAMLVSQFVTKPFRYFDHIRITSNKPSFATWKEQTFTDLKNGTKPAPDGRGFLVQAQLHPGVSEQQPSATAFTGKVFVLIDGFTFSTAADVCAQMRALTKATFIGEETGGAAEGNTSGLNADLLLPESKMKVRVQMYGYWNANQGNAKPGRGTLPDIEMPERIEDVLKGVDAALERAISLAK